MTNYQRLDTASTESAIAKPLETVWNAALEAQNNPIQLLKILRELEKLHQEIRDTLFQESLPDNRQALYVLLKDIENSGGWPYIYRTKLRELIDRLSQEDLERLLPGEPPTTSQ